MALSASASLSISRAIASDITVIDKYFDLLQSVLELYDLHDKPCQLFNVDKTGMPLNSKPLKMVCGTDQRIQFQYVLVTSLKLLSLDE